MDYIEIRNELRKQHRTEHFKHSDLLVFGLLLDEWIVTEWLNPFVVRISAIEKELDMPRSTVKCSLERLRKRRLIDYANGDRGQGRTILITWAEITDLESWEKITRIRSFMKTDTTTHKKHKNAVETTQPLHKYSTKNQLQETVNQKLDSDSIKSSSTNAPQIKLQNDNATSSGGMWVFSDEKKELEKFDRLMQEILDGKHQIWVDQMRRRHGIENISEYLSSFREHAIAYGKVGSVNNINGFKSYFNLSFRYFIRQTPMQLLCKYRETWKDENYQKYIEWILENASNVARNINPLTEPELRTLVNMYDKSIVFNAILDLNNREDLVGRYFSLFRTLYNWLGKR